MQRAAIGLSLGFSVLDRRSYECLQAKVTWCVVGRNAGNVVKLTGLRNLRLRWQNDGFAALFGLPFPSRRRQGNVLRVADKFLHPNPHLTGGLVRVEAEANHFAVVCRETHGVKGCRCDLVVGQIVDGVFPEGEAGAPLCQDEAHPRRTAGSGASFVVQQNRNASVDQTPVVFADAFVQIGKRCANVHLCSQSTEEALHLSPLEVGYHAAIQADQIMLAVLELIVIFVDVISI